MFDFPEPRFREHRLQTRRTLRRRRSAWPHPARPRAPSKRLVARLHFGRHREGNRDHRRSSNRAQGNRIRFRRLSSCPRGYSSPLHLRRTAYFSPSSRSASPCSPAIRLPRALAQNSTDQPTEEIVANLSAGRIIIIVTKDAILVGTVENPFEMQTHPPTPIVLSGDRVGVHPRRH